MPTTGTQTGLRDINKVMKSFGHYRYTKKLKTFKKRRENRIKKLLCHLTAGRRVFRDWGIGQLNTENILEILIWKSKIKIE